MAEYPSTEQAIVDYLRYAANDKMDAAWRDRVIQDVSARLTFVTEWLDSAPPPPDLHVGFPALFVCGPVKGQGRWHSVTHDVVIGAGRDADIRIDGMGVSRHHLAVSVDDDNVRVRDLDSVNGTHINGIPVNEDDLRDGDILTVGETQIIVLFPALHDHG